MKDMWKQQEAVEPAEDIRPMLGKNSNLPIARMKRHLVAELVVVVVLYGLMIFYFFNSHSGRLLIVAWLYLLIGIAFCVYFFKKLRLLKSMDCMACEVKANLSKQVMTLEKYVRFYLLAGTALVPVILIFFYLVQYFYFPATPNMFFSLPSEKVSVARSVGELLLIVSVSTLIMYFVNRWYVKKLYGKYVNQLKDMLFQMEEDAGREQGL